MTINDVKNIFKSIRKHNRKAIDVPAELEVDGRKVSCVAYDVSLSGVRLKVGEPIKENSQVIVKIRDKLNQVAKVVWSAEGFVGLNFNDNPKIVKSGLGTLAINLN
ncbi:MAG: PilZ domain-containing protein [Emcibacteraceae bacterium]|nr:PilZ domain-containing protein [Emcibacteraceae bacterium]